MTISPSISVKIRLRQGRGFAMGPGKADLLEAIQETSSIASASRSLGLSCTKTRRLLGEITRSFKAPLVVTARGGKDGGGTRLTAHGLRILGDFRAMEALAIATLEPLAQAFQIHLTNRD